MTLTVRLRRTLLPALVLAAALPASSWAADSGGSAPPAGGATPPAGDGGGTRVGQTVPRKKAQAPATSKPKRKRPARKRRSSGPVLTSFKLTRPRLFLYGRPARVSFRVEGRAGPVRVRVYLVPAGQRAAVSTILLGDRSIGQTHSQELTGREAGILPQGRYELRISVRDRRGRRIRRAPSASGGTADLAFFHHRFPLVGSFSYGGEGSLFGAPRPGRTHKGQDLAAAEGTPIVSPRGGVVETVQYQAGGAGHYAVVDGEDEDRDYVFMHMRTGSVVVREGQRIRTGQRIGEVGNTGGSSGPHLHFEVWTGGWFTKTGTAIDPLPLLRVWDSWS